MGHSHFWENKTLKIPESTKVSRVSVSNVHSSPSIVIFSIQSVCLMDSP